MQCNKKRFASFITDLIESKTVVAFKSEKHWRKHNYSSPTLVNLQLTFFKAVETALHPSTPILLPLRLLWEKVKNKGELVVEKGRKYPLHHLLQFRQLAIDTLQSASNDFASFHSNLVAAETKHVLNDGVSFHF